MTLLSVRTLAAAYGSAQALSDVSFDVAPSRVTALLGRNGMGKTTTVRCICRMMPCSGSITFDGQDLVALPSHRAARLGIGLVPEGRRCFASLTVRENLVAAARPGRWDVARVVDLFPRLGERLGQIAGSLSGGEQQMLAIGRALMTNPRLMILDEATEGLAPMIRAEIWSALHDLKTEGLSFVVIDKSIRELARIADTAVILDRGQSTWTGRMADVTDDLATRHLGL